MSALAFGKRSTGANIWSQGQLAARVPLGDIGRDISPYPFLLILGQDDNERLLGESLREVGYGRTVEHRAGRPRAGAGHVTATLRQPDGTLRELTPRGSRGATARTARCVT